MALDVIQDVMTSTQRREHSDTRAMMLELLSTIKQDLLNDSDPELKQQLLSLQTPDIESERV